MMGNEKGGSMSIFKRAKPESIAKTEEHSEEVPAEVIGDAELVETIKVRDIKQYLVDEYGRAQKLVELNEHQSEQLEEAQETKYKYDAALVTLDEYSARLKRYESEIENLNKAIDVQKEKTRAAMEQANSLKIAMHHMGSSQVIESVKEASLEAIETIKATSAGNISKSEVRSVISQVSENQHMKYTKDEA